MQELIEGYRLSPQQKRLWRLQQDGLPRRAQCALQLNGPLEPESLREALEITVKRHEILRSVFPCAPGMVLPIQVIAAAGRIEWRTIDWAGPSDDLAAARLAALMAEEEDRPAQPEQEPQIRATIVKLGSDRHILHLSLPTMCADSWTFKNLMRDLATTYEECLEDRVVNHEIAQYLQFSEWQNELLEDENAALGFAYWREQEPLKFLPTFPFKRLADARNGSSASAVALTLAGDELSQLDAAAESCNISTDILMLTCWQVLLWRVTGQERVTVGRVFTGRKFAELEPAYGAFAKVVPVQCRFKRVTPFDQLAQRVGEAVRDAQEWQEWFVWPEADGGHTSFPSAGFEYSTTAQQVIAGGVTFTILAERVVVDRFGLKLNVNRDDESLRLQLSYDAHLFCAADVELLVEQLRALLASVCERPRAAVGELQLMSTREWRRLVEEFNATKAEYPRDKLVQQLFEEQVKRTPKATAIVFGDEILTYKELNERANRLAHYLRSVGVGPEALVAIACERSAELIVALLGVLKAGGGYLPLDSTCPPGRLAYMLQDASVRVLLAQEHLCDRLPPCDIPTFCIDSDWVLITDQSSENPASLSHPENPVYVVYTSGSSGEPKGVVVPHRALLNYLSWCVGAYQVAEGSGTAVHSPFSFDLTVTALFPPLLTGRRIVLVPEQEGVQGLSAALQQHSNLSLIKITPSHLEVLSQLLPPESAGAAAAVIIGGEALTGDHLAFWREHGPAVRLINEYGPTETVVGCCIYEAPRETVVAGPVPIGRPIANMRLYVLDEQLQPAPTHVAGELYIGGDGLARGYLNRPDLTAAQFCPDPFAAEPGGRLYRTGDMARFLPEGVLEFLGRTDGQVKLRGFRIELGEIESALAQHPQVSEAVVAMREDLLGDFRLVAYCTIKEEVDVEELRGHLQKRLPEYMIPSSFVVLDELPLTSNGKVNRRALPAPEGLRPRLQADYVAPRTEAERTIAAIWQQVLQIDQVGINDSFFDLGGHSLLLVRVNRNLQEAFARKITILDLFKYPTIHGLAQFLDEPQSEQARHGRGHDHARNRKDLAVEQQELREKRRALKRAALSG